MAFVISGINIVQSGTDNNLSGMSALSLSGLTYNAWTSGGVNAKIFREVLHNVINGYVQINGTLTIDGETDHLRFGTSSSPTSLAIAGTLILKDNPQNNVLISYCVRGTRLGASQWSQNDSIVFLQAGGTLDIQGGGLICQQPINSTANGAKLKMRGGVLRAGQASNGALMMLRNTGFSFTWDIDGAKLIDYNIVIQGIDTFTNFKNIDFIVNAGGTNNVVMILNSNTSYIFQGLSFTGNANTHFATVANSFSQARKNIIYGWKQGDAIKCGKVPDWSIGYPWFEFRKKLNLTVRNLSNILIPNARVNFKDVLNGNAYSGVNFPSGVNYQNQITYQATSNSSGVLSLDVLNAEVETNINGAVNVNLNAVTDYRWASNSAYFTTIDEVRAYNLVTQNITLDFNGLSETNEQNHYAPAINYLTLTETQALALSGITMTPSGTTGGVVAISSARTIAELWQYYRAWVSQFANFGSNDTWTFDGTNLNIGAWTISGIQNLSGGKVTTSSATSVGAFSIEVIGIVSQVIPTNLSDVDGTILQYNTNTPITVTLTNCNGWTISNLGTAIVKLNLINSTVNTGERVTAQYPITVTDANGANFSTQIWVFNSLGNIVEDTGFNSLVASKTIYMPVGGSIRVYSQAYGTQSKITNTNATNASLVITHIPETLVDTSLPTATRDTIAGYFSSVVENSLLYVEVDTDLASYTPAEVLNGMHYFIVSNGGNFAALSLLANTVGSVQLIDGGFRVYSAFFKGRAKSNLNATNTPSLFITLPLYIEDASGVAGNQVMVRNANGIDVHAALWTKATANISQNDMNSIAGTTWNHDKRTLNDAIFE